MKVGCVFLAAPVPHSRTTLATAGRHEPPPVPWRRGSGGALPFWAAGQAGVARHGAWYPHDTHMGGYSYIYPIYSPLYCRWTFSRHLSVRPRPVTCDVRRMTTPRAGRSSPPRSTVLYARDNTLRLSRLNGRARVMAPAGLYAHAKARLRVGAQG